MTLTRYLFSKEKQKMETVRLEVQNPKNFEDYYETLKTHKPGNIYPGVGTPDFDPNTPFPKSQGVGGDVYFPLRKYDKGTIFEFVFESPKYRYELPTKPVETESVVLSYSLKDQIAIHSEIGHYTTRAPQIDSLRLVHLESQKVVIEVMTNWDFLSDSENPTEILFLFGYY